MELIRDSSLMKRDDLQEKDGDLSATAGSRRTQERGRLRRATLLATGRDLLQTRELDQISLTDVADSAGIPRSSAYHFFADVDALYTALADVIQDELLAHMRKRTFEECDDWQTIVREFTSTGAGFFNGDRASIQLLLGPKAPPEIKLNNRRSDFDIGEALRQVIGARFVLPEMPDAREIFFHAIEIADLFFTLSIISDGYITPRFDAEATAATTAYLQLYIPPRLAKREAADKKPRRTRRTD